MSEILGPRGGLAAAIPHYEDRPEQRTMAAAVSRALGDGRALLVEAGTGTGKTLAYLVPALTSGKKVIVSTGTRTLQEQIWRNDVPLLRQILGRAFGAVVLKGVANYVCKRRLDELIRLGRKDVAGDLDTIRDWLEHTDTGDRAEVEWIDDAAPIWSEITTTSETRIGPRCPYFDSCFVTQARRRAEKAELILVNHHLYFADLALRAASPGARVLPDHDAVVFDEAHQLEDVVTEHFGVKVSTLRTGQLVRDGLALLDHGALFGGGDLAQRLCADVDRAGMSLFARMREVLIGSTSSESRVMLPGDLFGPHDRQETWFRLDGALEGLADYCERESEPGPPEDDGADGDGRRAAIAGLGRRARAMRDDLATLAEQRAGDYVYWGEVRGPGVFLCASPIDVADVVRRRVIRGNHKSRPTPILTSATLTAAGSFSYTRARLGLDRDDVDELEVPSPFDYRRQALLYLPRDLPVPTAMVDETASAATCARIAELLAITAGRAFVLFTSHRALKEAAKRLAQQPYPLWVQGQAPRATLIERFRSAPGSVLLATGSFWEGVDVPGDALSMVIIDKLPFQPPNDPLVAARMRRIEERGGDPFASLQLPQAAIALKQGFGRLIRRRDDRGIVAILDPRIVQRSYGRSFLATLPNGLPRTSALEQVKRWWTGAPAALPAHIDEAAS